KFSSLATAFSNRILRTILSCSTLAALILLLIASILFWRVEIRLEILKDFFSIDVTLPLEIFLSLKLEFLFVFFTNISFYLDLYYLVKFSTVFHITKLKDGRLEKYNIQVLKKSVSNPVSINYYNIR